MPDVVPGVYSTAEDARARVAARVPLRSYLTRDGQPVGVTVVGVGE